jgi:hypothetical protein
MGDSVVVYRVKLISALEESRKHIERVDIAFCELSRAFLFPVSAHDFHQLLSSDTLVAFADQAIYRFSKAQDCIGAKLFKAFLLFQGENVDKPFLDILNALEKIDILKVESWFELREIRNEISHDYEENEDTGRSILNAIYEYRSEVHRILTVLESHIG